MSVFKIKILCMLMLYVVSLKVQYLVHYYLYSTLLTSVASITLRFILFANDTTIVSAHQNIDILQSGKY